MGKGLTGKTGLLLAALSAVVLAGCTTDIIEFASNWVEPEEMEVADQTFAWAGSGDAESIRTSFHSSVEDPGSAETWSTIMDVLEGADLSERRLIGINVNTVDGQRRVLLTYEGPASENWYVVNVRVRDGELFGFQVSPSEQSLVAANAFRSGSVGFAHAVLLLLGVGSIGIAMLASYRVLNSDIRRRKLWAVLPWVMIGRFTLNWTTGAFGLQLISIHVPPITFTKAGPAAPWLFGFGLPVFALIALRKAARSSTVEPSGPEQPGAAEEGMPEGA